MKTMYSGVILERNCYTEDFRRNAAEYAVEVGSMSQAADRFGVCVASIWCWLKAYDLARKYNKKVNRKNSFVVSPFKTRRHGSYNDLFRLCVVKAALKEGAKAASKEYGVSKGSVHNWLKAFNSNTAYLNNRLTTQG